MNILCVIDSLGSGGAQRQITQLASGFRERGHKVTFLTYHNENFFLDFLVERNINVICIEERNYIFRLVKMRKFIRQNNFDSILSFLEAANFICEISSFPTKRWKLVVGERNANSEILSSFKLRLYRYFHFFADHVVSNSQSNIDLVQQVNKFIAPSKFELLYNIVDLNLWKPKQEKTIGAVMPLKIIVLASQTYRKNLRGLVNALKLLDKDVLDNIIISWYGDQVAEPYYDGSFKEGTELLSKFKLTEKIIFYPADKNINEIIGDFDVIGLFSFNEGLPNAVCEGMACGKPILCSEIADIPSILGHQKEFLFDPNSPDKIAKAISNIVKAGKVKLAKVGETNRKLAENYFDKNKIVENYLRLLNNEKSFGHYR